MSSDIVVVGGGPVGASLARALRGTVTLVAAAPPLAALEAFDPRVYALSPGNVEFLRALGVWGALSAERLTPVHAMRIYGDDARAELVFDAYEAGVAELAWIVEDSALQRALWAGLASTPFRCERLEIDNQSAVLSFADAEPLAANLVVGADGANSFVRNAAGIAATERDYAQAALIANFGCERPHANAAFQWFQCG